MIASHKASLDQASEHEKNMETIGEQAKTGMRRLKNRDIEGAKICFATIIGLAEMGSEIQYSTEIQRLVKMLEYVDLGHCESRPPSEAIFKCKCCHRPLNTLEGDHAPDCEAHKLLQEYRPANLFKAF